MNMALASDNVCDAIVLHFNKLKLLRHYRFVQDTYDWIDSVTLSIGSERFSYGV
jgi:hypothetical protein